MSKARRTNDGHVVFWCPGCNCAHGPNSSWNFNGDLERPTFRPSILVSSGHYSPGRSNGSCWCTYNAEHPDEPAPFKCTVCHSFVTDGKIQFLSDSTHALAGQIVDLPEWENV